MNIDVSALPEEHREWVEGMVRNAIDMLREVEQLHPMAFIHSAANQRVGVVPMDTSSNDAKNTSAQFLRLRCADIQADACLFITEGWTLSVEKTKDYDAIITKYGSIGESPYRIDSLTFSFETAVLSYLAWPRIAPSKKKRRLAEDVRFIVAESSGRFSQFLSSNTTKKSKH